MVRLATHICITRPQSVNIFIAKIWFARLHHICLCCVGMIELQNSLEYKVFNLNQSQPHISIVFANTIGTFVFALWFNHQPSHDHGKVVYHNTYLFVLLITMTYLHIFIKKIKQYMFVCTSNFKTTRRQVRFRMRLLLESCAEQSNHHAFSNFSEGTCDKKVVDALVLWYFISSKVGRYYLGTMAGVIKITIYISVS